MKSIIIVPARLASTRLPSKPLVDICGKTMIRRVYEQAVKAGIGDVYVACSEDAVKAEMQACGAKAIMTNPDLPSGTDRIYAALCDIDPDREFDVVVNMQGDVPNIDPEIIRKTVNLLSSVPECDIATAVTKISDGESQNNPNVVKPVISFSDKDYSEAHYFSRAAIPYGEGEYYEHIGIYVYRREILERFVALSPSKLELREKLEQLRAIESGMRIFACLIDEDMKPNNVDTPEDLERVRREIAS